ncbi:VaFE repeat-containing surface-anchored protein [Lactococcus garvieae]|uniref:VaFE repeat-containing surface-anchored protein n=1 Tax=Lactococcus garvieae TaxID=1363 RepID=A0AA46TUJ1_9LACT|nr:VaFE repeat-containing surface-anchored protein [Lactococcus garvieae]UYT09826.1 VaFE repeat-containing surface-anchored protein [Lactococcus garvieae]UYT11800.1 VaFE repeat-containing surface-anchored protein [Lactococcus garvieae]
MKKNETKQTKFRMWKSKKIWLYGGAILLVVGGSAGAVIAQSDGLKSFSAVARSLPKPPTSGTVNYEYSGTGSAVWSDGHETSANFMKVNGQTTFCIDPFTDVFQGASATQEGQNEAVMKQWNAMTEEQRNLLNNITYIGLMNDADHDPNINLSTQIAQWMIEAGQNEIPGLVPAIHELDALKMNNVTGGRTIQDLKSTGANIQQVVGNATTIIKQAIAASKTPDFSPNPLEVIAGSSATTTDKNGVLAGKAGGYGTPFDNILSSEGLSTKRNGNDLEVSATPKAIGTKGKIEVWNNANRDFNPSYIYGTINPNGEMGQTLFCSTDPAKLEGQLKVTVIGLGEATLQKTSTNNAFANKKMAGAEFTLYTSDGKPVKWSDGHSGHPITSTAGIKANNTNVVLKMCEDAQLGVKNLDYTKSYYFMETKAPAGFALNAVKIPVTFDENSKFDGTTNNYQEDVATQDIPTGSTTLTKVDADTDSSETQGEATLKGVTYGLFHADGKAVEWSEGLTDKTAGSTENLPITPTFGTKADDKKVELTIDDSNKVGVQNLPLKENGKSFYWQELRTSSGYSQSTKKIPVVFDDKSEVDVATNDFADKDKASNKVNVFSFMFAKHQDVNGSLTGLNGAEFTLTPKEGTKGNPIVAVSGKGTDTNGYTVNGLTVFDGKANAEAGNPSKNGIAIGDYTLTESKTPNGLKPINDVDVSIEDEVDDKGNPLSYTATFTDTVTGQVIDKIEVDASSLVDNNLMFKVNLGIFTDKLEAQPKITTTATDKADGDKTLGVGHAQVTDLSKISGLLPNTEYTITGTVVYKGTGKPVMDKDGKKVVASKQFTTDKEGNAEVQLDFPLINNSQDENKEYTVTELVTDKDGNKVVEENNFKDNPSQTVKVADADGHTEVQTKELEVGKDTITDKFYYKDLVEGTEYTVKIKQAYDHDLDKVIDVDGELTFTAKGSSGTVDVPVKIDTKKYAGHKITLYEDAWVGKETEKNRPIIHHHDKNDESETFTVKAKTPTPTPEQPKSILPSTGEEKALWSIAGLGILLLGLAVWQRDKIKSFFLEVKN